MAWQLPSIDAVTTAEGAPPPDLTSPSTPSTPSTPTHAAIPLHSTRPRPGREFASGLALDAANPPFADGIVSPPHCPGAPLLRAPRHLPQQCERGAARSGGGGARVSARQPGTRGASAHLLLHPPPLAVRVPLSALLPLPPSLPSLAPPPPLFSLPGRALLDSHPPPSSPIALPVAPSPLPCHTLSAPLALLLIRLLISKRGSAAPGGAQRRDPARTEHLESGRRRPGAWSAAAAETEAATVQGTVAGTADTAGARAAEAAAEMSRRKQSKPRQIKRKFARGAGS